MNIALILNKYDICNVIEYSLTFLKNRINTVLVTKYEYEIKFQRILPRCNGAKQCLNS